MFAYIPSAKSSKFKYSVVSGVFILVLFILYIYEEVEDTEFEPPFLLETWPVELRDKPIILAWNNFFSYKALSWVGQCEESVKKACHFTADKSFTKIADAITFHSRNMENIPKRTLRNKDQVYVFWTMEAPTNAGNFRFPHGFFNWTMTFSPSSNVKDTYGAVKFVSRTNSTPQFPLLSDEVFKKKTESGIFGMISNCQYSTTKRLDIVKEIGKYYPVHLTGLCGWDEKWKELCPKGKECEQIVERTIEDHFFHFVLENSDCLGYVTEKTFSRLKYLSIPIASRRKCYETYGFPENVFIFLDDYENAGHLAHYLRYLEQNRTAYNEYFKWREEYEIVSTRHEENLCGVCKKIIEEKTSATPRKPKMIDNVYSTYTWCFETPVWNSTLISRFQTKFDLFRLLLVFVTVYTLFSFAITCAQSVRRRLSIREKYRILPTTDMS